MQTYRFAHLSANGGGCLPREQPGHMLTCFWRTTILAVEVK